MKGIHMGLTVKIAETKGEKEATFHIRYKTFCEELGIAKKEKYKGELETDFYDCLDTTKHYIVFYNGKPVCTSRVINENSDVAKQNNTRFGLSIEANYDLKSYEKNNKRAEITRLAILHECRKGIILSTLWRYIAKSCNEKGIENLVAECALETDCLDHALEVYQKVVQDGLFDPNYNVKRIVENIPKENPRYLIKENGEIKIANILKTCFRGGLRVIGEPSYYKNFDMLIMPLNWPTDFRYASTPMKRFFKR